MVYISVFQHTAHFQNHRNVQKHAVKLLPVSNNKLGSVTKVLFYHCKSKSAYQFRRGLEFHLVLEL